MTAGSVRSQSLDGTSLDGTWRIKKDPGGHSDWSGMHSFPEDALNIRVPGNIWEIVDYIQYNDYVWYSRTFTPEITFATNMIYYLRFGAVQYYSDVYLNGRLLGSHEGADTPFEYDVTDCLLQGVNRLTVRVKNPVSYGAEPVTFDMGGITQHVALAAQPAVRIKDVFAKPDFAGWAEHRTGTLALIITLENNTGSRATVNLRASVCESGSSIKKLEAGISVTADGRAETQVTMPISVTDCKLWSVNNPNLYHVSIISTWTGQEGKEAERDEYAFRTGFRDLRISEDGCFHLNHERIYIKSLHDTAFYPVIFQNTRDYSRFREVLVALKAAGFNTWRYLNYMPLPELLDMADEIGMIVYAEHQGSWDMRKKLDPAKFVLSVKDVIKASRNHPSLGIWGLLNETHTGAVFDAACGFLPELRAIDDTRLVLLDSGRFDIHDDETGRTQATIGSASNPGSSCWDVYLGGEHPTDPVTTGHITDTIPRGFINFTGDSHIYQYWPNTPLFYHQMAELAQSTRPIFVSEAGAGNSYNPIGEQLKLQQAGADPRGFESVSFLDKMSNGLLSAWSKYDLYDVYPVIEDFSLDSFRQQTRQREIMFSVIRSNPKIMGYSLTSKIDGGGYGEGIFDAFNEFKPGIMDVLQAGWSRLRWNLFVNPGAEHTYTDQAIHIKVSLANEDELPTADVCYPVTLRIAGEQGVVWTKAIADFHVSGNLADPVFEGTIAADQFHPPLAEGVYTLSATMTRGGHPSSNKMLFFVTDRNNHKSFSGKRITVLGVGSEIRELFIHRNASVFPYNPSEAVDHEVIVVGDRAAAAATLDSAEAWRALYRKVANGAHVLFLDPSLLSDGTIAGYDGHPDNFRTVNTNNKWIPLEGKGTQRYNEKTTVGDWLYHKEYIAKRSGVFEGMSGTGLMDPEYYSGLFVNAKYFSNIAVPDETAAVALFCNMGTVFDGVAIGTYNFYGGRFTINSFSILEHIGTPAADRLLLNMAFQAGMDAAQYHPVAISEPEWGRLGID